MRKLAVVAAATLFGAAVAPTEARAFCGFYVAPNDAPLYADATMVALMREGNRTSLSMSNNYKGPAADFAMVVPVPVVLQKEAVKTLPHTTFQKLEQLSAPRLVEYWEQNPCAFDSDDDKKESVKKKGKAMAAPGAAKAEVADEYKVKIEAQFAVGEYDIVILSAEESDGLEKWLIANKYNIPKGASAALAPYVKEQMKFFVAKVDIKKVTMNAEGVATLSPLRVTYESNDFRLPVRLGLLNASGKQDLIVYILSKTGRYEVANYANTFIPTNIDVADETRNQFGAFYAALFDATLAKAGNKAIVTEYAWTSAGCDPCPTPPLGDSDVATLGGDVLLGMASPVPAEIPVAPPPAASGSSSAAPSASVPTVMGTKGKSKAFPGGGFFGGTTHPVVLTRLHARYDAATLGEDLVFRAAAPIAGGREFVTGSDGAIEKGAVPSGINNFQARYAIRHLWQGPITCAKPRRGVWGGPPPGTPAVKPAAATGLAAAPRDKVQLASLVKSRVDELDIVPPKGKKAAQKPEADEGNVANGGWLWFVAGAGGTLLVVGLLAMVLKKKA